MRLLWGRILFAQNNDNFRGDDYFVQKGAFTLRKWLDLRKILVQHQSLPKFCTNFGFSIKGGDYFVQNFCSASRVAIILYKNPFRPQKMSRFCTKLHFSPK
jgi:hypothetical protein